MDPCKVPWWRRYPGSPVPPTPPVDMPPAVDPDVVAAALGLRQLSTPCPDDPMPDKTPYFEPFEKKKSIIDRVHACRPLYMRSTERGSDGGWDFFFFTVAKKHASVPESSTTALARQAGEDWARSLLLKNNTDPVAWRDTAVLVDIALRAPDHTKCNAALHALADMLEQEKNNG